MSEATCGNPNRRVSPGYRFAHPGYRRASSPPFFVRPGAAGLLLPSSARKGVRNAWAFHRTRGPVCKGGRKDAHELLTNAAPRLRSARAGLTACRIPAEPSPAHLTKYGGPHRIAGPLGPSALGAVVIPFRVHASSPRREQGRHRDGPVASRSAIERRFERALTSERDGVKNIPSDWEMQEPRHEILLLFF